jgi:cell division septation protein DedD
MRDLDKIKEKDKKDEFKSILLIGMVFLVALGIIVYILISLTNQYFDLKTEIETVKSEKQVAMTNPEEGEAFEYKLDKSKIKVEKIKKDIEKEAELKFDETEEKTETTAKTTKSDLKTEKVSENKKASAVSEKSKEKKQAAKTVKKVEKQSKKATAVKKAKASEKPKTVKKSKKSNLKYNYVIQLMAFKTKASALKEFNKYKGKLDNLHILRVDLGKKGVWYRLRCGKFETYADAKKQLNIISKKYKIKPIVVKR